MSRALVIIAVAFAAACARHESAAPSRPLAAADEPTRTADDAVDDERAAAGWFGVVLAGDSVDIAAKSDARILAVRVAPGAHVKAGAVLVTLDRHLLQQRLSVARAELAEANERYARRQPLARADATISKEELSLSRMQVLEQRARVAELAQALADADVRAPFDGTVAARFVDGGALTAAGRPLLRLLSDAVPRVRFAVPPADAATLAPGAAVAVRVDGVAAPVRATVESVAPEIDSAARLVFVLARLDVPAARRGEVRAGQLARVRGDGEGG